MMITASRFVLSCLLVLGVGSVSAFVGIVPPLRTTYRQLNAAPGAARLATTGCERRQRHGVVMQAAAGSGAGGGNKNAEVPLLFFFTTAYIFRIEQFGVEKYIAARPHAECRNAVNLIYIGTSQQ